MLSVKVKMAVPMVFPFLNPHCSGTKILFTAGADLIY